MINASEGLNQVLLRKVRRFDCSILNKFAGLKMFDFLQKVCYFCQNIQFCRKVTKFPVNFQMI